MQRLQELKKERARLRTELCEIEARLQLRYSDMLAYEADRIEHRLLGIEIEIEFIKHDYNSPMGL